MNLIWIEKGGIFIWPLLLCSIIGLAAIVNRFFFFWHSRVKDNGLLSEFLTSSKNTSQLNIPRWLEHSRCPLHEFVMASVIHRHEPREIREEALKRKGNKIIQLAEEKLRLIGSIAQVAPLLGLLGTVFGLVTAFYHIELSAGMIQPSDLAGGIWAALLTTVAGLCIGIPCLLVHQYFNSRVDLLKSQLEEIASELEEIIYLQSKDNNREEICKTSQGNFSYTN